MREEGQGGCTIVLYADILIATNALVDYFLLMLCASIRRHPVHRLRMAAACLIGGVSALQILLHVSVPVSGMLSILSGTIMCLIAFGHHTLRETLLNLLSLFGVSFAYSGAMYAVWFLVAPTGLYWHNGVTYFSISPLLFVLITALCYAVLTILRRIFLRRQERGGALIRLKLTGNGTCTEGQALLDSGNLLTEPVSGFPVIVADAALVEPVSVPLAAFSDEPSADETRRLSESHFRFVHFHTIAGGGLLPACMIEGVASPDGTLLPSDRLYVASCRGLREKTGYDAIIPRAAFNSTGPSSTKSSCDLLQERYDHHVQSSAAFSAPDIFAPVSRARHGFLHQWRRHTSCAADCRTGNKGHESDPMRK